MQKVQYESDQNVLFMIATNIMKIGVWDFQRNHFGWGFLTGDWGTSVILSR
jgi:hypothetical protein